MKTSMEITARTTIRDLAEFMEKVGPEERVRAQLTKDGNAVELYVRNRSFIEFIQENLIPRCKQKVIEDRKLARDSIAKVLEGRVGGEKAETAMKNIRTSLENLTHDVRPGEISEYLPDIDPEDQDTAIDVNIVEGAFHGMVQRWKNFQGNTEPKALQDIEEFSKASAESFQAISQVIGKNNPGNAAQVKQILTETLYYLNQRVSGGKHAPFDYSAISELKNLAWPDANATASLTDEQKNIFNLLRTFAGEMNDPSTLKIFTEGLKEIRNIVLNETTRDSDTSENKSPTTKNPTSVKDILDEIFRPKNNLSVHLNALRDTPRPSRHLGFNNLSAEAVNIKVMTVLAIAEDPACLTTEGKLDIARTKAVIQRLFSISGKDFDIPPDDRVFSEIAYDKRSKALKLDTQDRLKISLQEIDEIREKLKENLSASGLGSQEITLDLNSVPRQSVAAEFSEAVLGDMHGNSVMFLHELVNLGFIEIQPGKDEEWQKLVESIRNNDIQNFRSRLSNVLRLSAPDKKLILLGDLLSDKTGNDWLTLNILDFLHEEGQKFEIIFSNHDAAFLEYFLAHRDLPVGEKFKHNNKVLKHGTGGNESLFELNKLLNAQTGLREEFKRMTENYIKHLKILSTSDDGEYLYSHGAINEAMLSDMAAMSDIAPEAALKMTNSQRVEKLNVHFHSKALTDLQSFQAFFQPSINIEGAEGQIPNPFYATLWNIGVAADNGIFNGNPRHKYCNTIAPQGVHRVIHGHTPNLAETAAQAENLPAAYQAAESLVDDMLLPQLPLRDTKKDLRELIGILGKIQRNSGKALIIGSLLDLVLQKYFSKFRREECRVNDEGRDGRGRIKIKSHKFFEALRNIPKDERNPDFKATRAAQYQKMIPMLRDYFSDLHGDSPDTSLNFSDEELRNFIFAMSLADGVSSGSTALIKSTDDLTRDRYISAMKNVFVDMRATTTPNDPEELAAKASFLQISRDSRSHMESYLSLDGDFGAAADDVQGSRLAFIL